MRGLGLALAVVAAVLAAPESLGSRTDAGPPGASSSRDANPALGEVQVIGEGPTTLLIIPCASCRWRSFEEFAERNRERFTTVAVTLPGYGGTATPELPLFEAEPRWQPYALDALERLLDEKDLREVTVIGHSFGALIAVQLAARRPDRISGFINLDGSIIGSIRHESRSDEERLEAARTIREQYMEPLSDPDAWQRFNLPAIDRDDRRILYHGWFMATDRAAVTQYWWENLLQARNSWLKSLSIPVLDVQLYGPSVADPEERIRTHKDRAAALGLGDNYKALFYDQTGHFLMEDRPDLLDALVTTFSDGRSDYPQN